MTLRIGEKVRVYKSIRRASFKDQIYRIGEIIDLKWSLVLIKYDNGETGWVDSRVVWHLGRNNDPQTS